MSAHKDVESVLPRGHFQQHTAEGIEKGGNHSLSCTNTAMRIRDHTININLYAWPYNEPIRMNIHHKLMRTNIQQKLKRMIILLIGTI